MEYEPVVTDLALVEGIVVPIELVNCALSL
jgi:hypothetical protein